MGMRRSYVSWSIPLIILLALDIVFNAIIESEADATTVTIYSGIQIAGRVITVFVILIRLSSTLLFHFGLLGILFGRFKSLVALIIFSALIMIGVRVYRIIKLFGGEDAVELAYNGGYITFIILHNFG